MCGRIPDDGHEPASLTVDKSAQENNSRFEGVKFTHATIGQFADRDPVIGAHIDECVATGKPFFPTPHQQPKDDGQEPASLTADNSAQENNSWISPALEAAHWIEGVELEQPRLTVPEVLPLVQAIYARSPTGCCLHIVLDDGNVEDGAVSFCLETAIIVRHEDCEDLARKLGRMSKTQRKKLGSMAFSDRRGM